MGNLEESKKAAAARKREKKKRKKMEKLAEKGLLPPDLDNKENEDFEAVTTEDEKEKTPELLISNQNQDSGIDANSQASSSEPDSGISGSKIHGGHGSMIHHGSSNNSSSHSNSSSMAAKNNLSNSEDNSK